MERNRRAGYPGYDRALYKDLKLEFFIASTVAKVAFLWIFSDVGFYLLKSLLGPGSSYSNNPFVLGEYYLIWVALTLFLFWDLYRRWKAVRISLQMVLIMLAGGAAVAYYLFHILPLFPPLVWSSELKPPAELFSASVWYFFPKSIEIAFQQLLVAAMVISFNLRRLPLQRICAWSAMLFGSIHLLLIFGGFSVSYTLGFMMAALVAGYVFPYLMLRVRNGYLYSYFLHWGFYAVVIVLVRMFL